MFDLVADVEHYPEFVPLCERLACARRKSEGEREVLVADMTVAYRFVRETFTTRVTLDRAGAARSAPTISTARSAISRTAGASSRSTAASSRRSSFAIDYEFRSRTLALLMGAVFDRAFRKFAEAFEARADAVYGKTSG